jgi:hypothetical protein
MMQLYQRFMCDAVALIHEIKRLSADAVEGQVSVDKRLLHELARLSTNARNGFNGHLEYVLQQNLQRLRTRFKLERPNRSAQEKADHFDKKIKEAEERLESAAGKIDVEQYAKDQMAYDHQKAMEMEAEGGNDAKV